MLVSEHLLIRHCNTTYMYIHVHCTVYIVQCTCILLNSGCILTCGSERGINSHDVCTCIYCMYVVSVTPSECQV